ncbi:MAG: hypothetical protein IJ859_06060 [Synergistaceae bacterium]|nr:hypothetical protein [Synergistaceae bacterium]
MKNYSILVNSCDAYSDAWPMFFFLLKKHWQNVGGGMPRVYLNCETLQYHDDDIEIINLNHADTRAWGERLLKCLDEIDDEIILMMLEDYYYEADIKTDIIAKCVDYMEADKKILAFQLEPTGEVFTNKTIIEESQYPGFVKRKRFAYFKLVAGPTLWRKSELIRYTNKNDTPWDWEFFGSLRTWLNSNKIYCWTSFTDRIFDFDGEHGGAIHRGKWVGYKIEELSKKYNFPFDYGTREVEYDWIKEGSFFNVPPFYKRLRNVIRNRSKFVFEIIRGLWI